jgi:hypothetical protein
MDSTGSSTSDARALAADLAARDDATLRALFTARSVSASAPWRDFFDAAEALLEPASIDRTLIRLPRSALAALSAGTADDTVRADLVARALAYPDGTPYRAVAERVQALAGERPDAFTPSAAPADPPKATGTDAAAAAERAALSIASLADVLLAALAAPPARTGAGAVSATDRKRMLEAGAVSSGEELDDLLASAEAAGLATRGEREWLDTTGGEQWLRTSTARRWEAVAEGFRAALPAALRTTAGGITPPAAWPDAYPLDLDWPVRQAVLARIARRWGLVTPSGAEPEWAATLRSGAPADAASLSVLLPPEIDRIYLQADLSAIAPGPLAPALDLRLRTMAVRESRAQASTYRFTAESIAHAVGTGETAESLRGFLTALSLTGIPQPLDYLIDRTAARHGLVRVRADVASGRTEVASNDPALLDTLEVDQSVRPIGLIREGHLLTSRVARDAVYWTLDDARYPAVALTDDGEPEPLQRRRLAPAGTETAHPYARLLEALRTVPAGDADAAWLGRELDAAVRARATIVVVAALPDGSTREFTLEATGIGGGRLRGRDRGSDTERTLPVSSIVSARPA